MSTPATSATGRRSRITGSRIDPLTRATFREVARSIIAKDRDARRLGWVQNTIGEIERALVRAYAMGRAAQDEGGPTPDSEAVGYLDWIRVPPRSREVLASLSHCFSAALRASRFGPAEIECFTEDGRRRWAQVVNGTRHQHSVADGSVAPLVRLELIAAIDPAGARYGLTPIGIATCREYWRRVDANDPTLPRISMR